MCLIAYTILSSIMILANMYYFLEDINEAVRYYTFLTYGLASMLNFYTIIQHSDTLLRCVQLISIDGFSYEYHDRQTLEIGRKKAKFFAKLNNLYWIMSVVFWSLMPLFPKVYYVQVKFENKIYLYRYNLMNFVYPINTKFYNDHFVSFYIFEMILTIIWTYTAMIFDMLIISVCITFSNQLETIVKAFTTFGDSNIQLKGKI